MSCFCVYECTVGVAVCIYSAQYNYCLYGCVMFEILVFMVNIKTCNVRLHMTFLPKKLKCRIMVTII